MCSIIENCKTKLCKNCNNNLSLNKFRIVKKSGKNPYLYHFCKLCENYLLREDRKRQKEEDPESYKAKAKIWNQNSNYRGSQKQKETKKTYRKENRNKLIDYTLRRNYNITSDDYKKMLEEQNHVCAICKKPETAKHSTAGTIRELCVDHDHTTGKVRGLLCHACNVAIGLMKDDPITTQNATNYLNKFKNT